MPRRRAPRGNRSRSHGYGVAVGAAVRSDWGYRPHLDGVRTLAVYLVVAFHAGLVRFDGGFIGVDVFFVLSGYLVTSLLLRDVAKVGGVRLRQFYSRRIRRLLPAAVVNLTVTAVVFAAIASPVEAAGAVGAVRAAALYVANWYFIGQSADYFARNITASPVIHYWSLSVEEQFYILWPLLLSGLVLAGRRRGVDPRPPRPDRRRRDRCHVAGLGPRAGAHRSQPRVPRDVRAGLPAARGRLARAHPGCHRPRPAVRRATCAPVDLRRRAARARRPRDERGPRRPDHAGRGDDDPACSSCSCRSRPPTAASVDGCSRSVRSCTWAASRTGPTSGTGS